MSQPARACYILLKCSGVPFQPKLVDLKKAKHFNSDYHNSKYFRKVPSIDDNGYKLSESVAIMKYVLKKNKQESSWLPENYKIEAKVEEFLHWYHLNLRLNFGMYYQTMILDPVLTGNHVDKFKANHFFKKMNSNLKSMNNYFLSEQNSFIGGSPSMTSADILAACELSQNDYLCFNLCEFLSKENSNYPNVLNWYTKVKKNTQPHFDVSHKLLILLKKRLQSKPQRISKK